MWGNGVSAGGGGSGGSGGLSPRATGWGNYRDTAYTSGSPLTLVADTRTALPNNAATKDESQLPEDMLTFYSAASQKIFATNGSDFILSVRLKVKPLVPEATYLKLEMEIASPVPVLIEATHRTLPWGINEENSIAFTLSGYAREAFAQYGCKLFVTCDGSAEIYGMSYVIKRTHKGV